MFEELLKDEIESNRITICDLWEVDRAEAEKLEYVNNHLTRILHIAKRKDMDNIQTV